MTSELLCNAIGNELAPYIGEEGCIRLIQCFLNPQLMLCHPEPPKPLSVMVSGAKPRHTVDREEKKIDHLYEFFTRNEHQQIGEDFGRCQVYNRLLTAAATEFLYHFDVYVCWNLLPPLSVSFSS